MRQIRQIRHWLGAGHFAVRLPRTEPRPDAGGLASGQRRKPVGALSGPLAPELPGGLRMPRLAVLGIPPGTAPSPRAPRSAVGSRRKRPTIGGRRVVLRPRRGPCLVLAHEASSRLSIHSSTTARGQPTARVPGPPKRTGAGKPPFWMRRHIVVLDRPVARSTSGSRRIIESAIELAPIPEPGRRTGRFRASPIAPVWAGRLRPMDRPWMEQSVSLAAFCQFQRHVLHRRQLELITGRSRPVRLGRPKADQSNRMIVESEDRRRLNGSASCCDTDPIGCTVEQSRGSDVCQHVDRAGGFGHRANPCSGIRISIMNFVITNKVRVCGGRVNCVRLLRTAPSSP